MLSFVMAGVIRVSTLQSCQKWPPATPIANRLHGKIRLDSEFCKRLSSRPVDISARADWADYRRSWRESSASELNAIAYRGQGTTRIVPDGSTVIDIALEIISSPGGVSIDSGNLQATVSVDGATMDGRIWSNSAQAERPVRLTRVLPAK